MKQVLILVLALMGLESCAPSQEKKAQLFAENIMKQVLYYPDSYEGVACRVDSAFVSIYTDNEAYLAVCELQKLQDGFTRNLIETRLNSARSSLAIWSDGWGAYAREERRQAQQEIAKYEKELKEYDEQIEKQQNIIKQRAASINEGEYCGWNIQHSYRCQNGMGMSLIGNVLIVSDPDFVNPIFFCSLEDDDENSYRKIKEIIDSVLK